MFLRYKIPILVVKFTLQIRPIQYVSIGMLVLRPDIFNRAH